MTAITQNIFGILAIIITVVAAYWADARWVYKKPTSFPGHFFRTSFFPRRALAYSIVIMAILTILASVRNGFPKEEAAYAILNNIVVVLIYPLMFSILAMIAALIVLAIRPEKKQS